MSKPIKVICVFGTRPEAIKFVPVIINLAQDKRFQVASIATGQHREMLDQVLDLFHIAPEHDLSIMAPGQSLARIVADSIGRLSELLARLGPDIVLVQGDTSTTFVASLAAFYNRIPVGHVEAGLRTGDRFEPFPEEMNRRLTSVIADFHFAPTSNAAANLLGEGIDPDKIFVTGNTGIDALHLVLQTPNRCRQDLLPENLASKCLLFVTAHRRENHGRPMRSICRALTEIVDRRADTAVVFPVHYSPQVRAEVFPALSHVERIWLCDPLDYSDTAQMLKRAALILTDSGGLQEEAPSLGKPVLVLRNKTERMEGILAGTARLVGTQTDRIVREACDLLSRPDLYEAMANATNPYGDGGAAKRIAEFMLYTFGRCSVKPSPFGSPVKAL